MDDKKVIEVKRKLQQLKNYVRACEFAQQTMQNKIDEAKEMIKKYDVWVHDEERRRGY